jgi:hypothetical protein
MQLSFFVVRRLCVTQTRTRSRTRTWRLVRDSDSRVGDSDLDSDSRVRDSDLDLGFRDSTTSLPYVYLSLASFYNIYSKNAHHFKCLVANSAQKQPKVRKL